MNPASRVAGGQEAAYAACRAVVDREARSFKWAIRLLPARHRDPMAALYAFCRAADDAADSDAPIEERRAALARVRAGWNRAWQEPGSLTPDPSPLTPVFIAFAGTAGRHGIVLADVESLLLAVEADLVVTRYRDREALERYCDGVAGTVGRMSAAIFGGRGQEVSDLATRTGLGMQIANILRDVAEDARRGRVYLPLAELAAHGIGPEGILSGSPGPGFAALVGEMVARARMFLGSAPDLARLLPRDVRFFPGALARTYEAILDRIEQEGCDPVRCVPRLPRWRAAGIALACRARGFLPSA